MNLELITKQVANLSRVMGSYLKSELKGFKKKHIEKKGENDFVSYVDRTSEKRIVTELKKILPEAGIIAEENNTYEKKKRFNWIIDPLDGTTNYIHGVPLFSISIALLDDDKIISGVIYEVNLNECFYAWENGGAYLNGKKIRSSEISMLSDGLIATGFPYSDFSRMDAYLDVFTELMKNTHGVRRLGSAAVDLAYVACGRYDAFYEYGLNPWDVAAGCILITEAGGVVSDFSGKGDFIFGREIIASNKNIYDQFLNIVRWRFS
ncbi:MAG: inositol monophosphatase [Bacteroidales bacterium]|nr:inositol monophosphatase [Bacteroidales bacterium]MCF8403431.1 inositol monophosphatase [Bacteroidales bacterium]